MADLPRIYEMFRKGDVASVGPSYLIDHYNRGRLGIMRPDRGPAAEAWRAGRDAAKAGEPNPFPKSN